MIELRDVTKRRTKRGKWHYVARNINLTVGRGKRVALMGPGESGKTTLLRLICGTEQPDSGEVIRDARASWPIPAVSFLSSQLSAAANIRFLARLFEVDTDDYLARVKELSELGSYINEQIDRLSSYGKNQLAFSLAVCMDFDVYLFDDSIGVGPPPFRKKCAEIIEQLGQQRGIVIATGSANAARQFCDEAYVLDEGHAFHYFDMSQAVSHYKDVNQRREAEREASGAADSLVVR
jgi:capsular polysaccharide transport system ATP-binding protein